jgi:DNA-binding LytR/AlgR family response regulator
MADQIADPPALLSGRRVLVIEDEYFIADELRQALAGLGAEIIGPFPDLTEAENVVNRGEPIDAALLDINVRSEMIFPLARTLRSCGVPLVFTTGYDKASVTAEFQDVPLLEKPLDIRRVVRLLAGLTLGL